MSQRFLIACLAIALPFAAANYGPAPNAPNHYGSAAASQGIDELYQAAGGSQQGAAALAANAEDHPSAAEAARLNVAQAQLQALNSNPTYQSMRNSEAIAESLAENTLAQNIRGGHVNIVAPNVVDQGVYRSLLVPSGRNNHQVIATQPLPPIVVHQPGAPPAHISSGPPSVVRAAPVIYKIKPSVIFQQEVINKVPTPLSLNPVYVKVYKPGKQIGAPAAPVVQPGGYHHHHAPSHGYGAHGHDSYANAAHAAPVYAAPAPPAPSHHHHAGPASYAPAGAY